MKWLFKRIVCTFCSAICVEHHLESVGGQSEACVDQHGTSFSHLLLWLTILSLHQRERERVRKRVMKRERQTEKYREKDRD